MCCTIDMVAIYARIKRRKPASNSYSARTCKSHDDWGYNFCTSSAKIHFPVERSVCEVKRPSAGPLLREVSEKAPTKATIAKTANRSSKIMQSKLTVRYHRSRRWPLIRSREAMYVRGRSISNNAAIKSARSRRSITLYNNDHPRW